MQEVTWALDLLSDPDGLQGKGYSRNLLSACFTSAAVPETSSLVASVCTFSSRSGSFFDDVAAGWSLE